MAIDYSEVTRYGGVPKVGRAAPESTPAASTKGPQATARHQKKLKQARTKAAIREQVRELDGFRCRWPECETSPETSAGALEVAHYEPEGRGGDPLLARYCVENLILLCHSHHRGNARSIHSGYAQMKPMSDRGMRGPVIFLQRENAENPRWYLAGISEPPAA